MGYEANKNGSRFSTQSVGDKLVNVIENTINTLIKVFSGLILASVIAIHLGILIGRNQTLEELTSFVISILRLFPPVAWIPFSILWFGIGSVPAVFIIFMGCVSLF